ncbi:MAG: hypothetical protein IJ106_07500 [Parasporobacterium sp.]|nr:hypothetical protein [Parasporobacterium sp.]
MKNGVYNAVEQAIVDEVNNIISPATAANKTVNVPVATQDAIRNFTEWVDPWNPLFKDGTIAPPHFLESVNSLTVWPPHPAEGFLDHDYAGDYFEYDRPIRAGDSFTVSRSRNIIEDISEQVGDGLRHFAFCNNFCDVFDAAGRRVGRSETLVGLTLRPQPNVPDPDQFPYSDHIYTPEEWEYINSIIDGEQIRGQKPRYWEDVRLGEKITPVTIGPTTIWDMVAFCAARHEIPFHPSRFFRSLPGGGGLIEDEITHNTFVPLCWHFSAERSRLVGNARPFNFGGSGANQMLRLATNWCGDDGQVRVLNWRHVTRTHHGDCTIGYGRVVRKYKRGDEYCVDIQVFLLNECRGNLSETAVITVALPTRASAQELEKGFGEMDINQGFQAGDKVRISGLPEYVFPTGYPLAGAEGIVQYRFQWQAADFHPFGGYTSLKITKHDKPLSMGNVVAVPTDLLEKI